MKIKFVTKDKNEAVEIKEASTEVTKPEGEGINNTAGISVAATDPNAETKPEAEGVHDSDVGATVAADVTDLAPAAKQITETVDEVIDAASKVKEEASKNIIDTNSINRFNTVMSKALLLEIDVE